MLSLCLFDISAGVGAFVIGLSQISSFLSFYCMHHFAINVLYQCQVQSKWSKCSCTEQKTTFQLTAATRSKIAHNCLKIYSSNILIWRAHIDILMLGKSNPLSRLREHDAKIQIVHVEHYRESDRLFVELVRSINPY